MRGTVKRFFYRKGFGFIENDQGEQYFFHYTDFSGGKSELRPGKAVEFTPEQGDKGPCAVGIAASSDGGEPPVPGTSERPRSAPSPAAPRPAALPQVTAADPEKRALYTGMLVGFAGGVAGTVLVGALL